MKEYRVFVGDIETDYENSANVEEWYEYEQQYDTLHPNAEIWLQHCERNGTVYSLTMFSIAYNYDEVNQSNTYIYITNNY